MITKETLEQWRAFTELTTYPEVYRDMAKALLDHIAALEREKAIAEWTEDIPTEQSWYWHWNGNRDDSPFVYSILKSGTNDECFIQNSHWAGAPWCKDVGGWWMRIQEPSTPAEKEARP